MIMEAEPTQFECQSNAVIMEAEPTLFECLSNAVIMEAKPTLLERLSNGYNHGGDDQWLPSSPLRHVWPQWFPST